MSKDKYNILWICTDQQRRDTLGCYGNTLVNTPHLDKLAKESVLFDNCFCQGTVCTPSRASFLTGRYPRTARCHQNGQDIPEDQLLVTKLLADAGYTCGLSGKLHISACHTDVCDEEPRIDDAYKEFHWSHHPYPSSVWGDKNEYSKWLREKGVEYKNPQFSECSNISIGMPEEHHQSTWCAEKAIEFIDKYKTSGEPWLFSVNFFDPHHPFDAPEKYLKPYLDRLDDIPLPAYTPGELENKPIWQRIDHHGASGGRSYDWSSMSEKDHKILRASYYAMCDLIDVQVGRLLAKLDEEGLRENTIVIFSSDHGEMLGDHGFYLKGPFFYEQSTRVPLIVSLPEKIKSQKYDGLVELSDLAPSLLEANGLAIHPGMQAKSFWGLIAGEDSDYEREDVFCEFYETRTFYPENPGQMSMLRTKKHKIVVSANLDVGELYDLENDPSETHNLWDNEDYALLKGDMALKLANRLTKMTDPLPEQRSWW